MKISPEVLFSSMRQGIIGKKFSTKSIRKEKRRIVEQRKKKWASLGGQALHLLAVRYADDQEPAKASVAQFAYFAHRLITILPGFILSPIAAILGGLKAQIGCSDAKVIGSLKQKNLLNILTKLNEKIDELCQVDPDQLQTKGKKPTSGNYKISPKVFEDFKAILTFTRNFDEIYHEKLKDQIARFEKFLSMINVQEKPNPHKSAIAPTFINPHNEEEI